MKELLIIASLILVTTATKAQKTADVGFWGGVGTSLGDMTQPDWKGSLSGNVGAFVRYNFNPRLAARLQLITGGIKGEGTFDSQDWSFGSKNVTSLSLMAEINFLRYILGEKETPFSPYLLAGVGVSFYPYNVDPTRLASVVAYDVSKNTDISGDVFALHIPVGFGVKCNLSKRMGIGAEVLMHRHFSDKIDDLDDPRRSYTDELDASGLPTGNYKLISNNDSWHNNDYTIYLGLHLTYRFNFSRDACPVYEYK